MFKKVDPKQNFPMLEEKILKFWKKNKIFEKSLTKKSARGDFIFYEGPPTANGKPGIHHVLARAFKDLIPRYKTMKGYHVERKAGWDTHGLPIELEVEKKLKISGKPEIEKYGIKKFNEKCKESVWFFKDEWEKMTERIAFWLDLDDPYITYNNDYIESVWWILKQVWNKKLLYLGHKVVPQCPRCGTALSSHEVAQGYKKITETSVYVKFALINEKNTYVLAWTTTPWTLPGNVALALGENINYVKVKQENEYYFLAEDRLKILEGKYQIVQKYQGKDLKGKKYKPLFDFLNLEKSSGKKAYYLTLADFVSTKDGTGVVHTAVMYGEDDYLLGDKIGLPKYHTVDENGKFTVDVKPWAGRFVKDVDNNIIKYLKDHKVLYKVESITHDYPFCWRCDTPLIYYAKDSWFIKMSALRHKLIANNKKINWVPGYIKEGRFGEWLKEAKDWALSRERYWGTPLPIWQCQECNHQECIGSISELKKRAKNIKDKIDLHRPWIDKITFNCAKCSSKMQRVKEVIDCWFDSGAMPFAQYHYPFENKNLIDGGKIYPADYISEAIDQTRGWFYTLLAISTLLEKSSSYKNVICLGHILDAKGQKMSKSRGNVVNPWEIINKYGADILRFHLYTINQPGNAKRFNEKELVETLRKNIIVLWNVYSFFITYANVDKWNPNNKNSSVLYNKRSLLDQWISAKFNKLNIEVSKSLDKYDIFQATRKITAFIEELSTWYLRLSRKRRDQSFYQTLYNILCNLSYILTPFMPFITEEIYQNLRQSTDPESIHLCKWPKISEKRKAKSEKRILDQMQNVREIVEIVHSIRKEQKIKVRQPLSELLIANSTIANRDLLNIISQEVNVKQVTTVKNIKKEKNWIVKEQYHIKVALNIKITKELAEEGNLRELIRQIQFLRKKYGITANNKIKLFWQSDSNYVRELFKKYSTQIAKTTLCSQINNMKVQDSKINKEIQINQKKIYLAIK